MSIVTITHRSSTRSRKVAELVAKDLGYRCLGGAVLREASKEFDIPAADLARAIEDPPSFFGSLSQSKKRHLSYMKAILLRYFKEDNIVYHGLLGHYFLPGIHHVLKVCVLADMNLRVEEAMKRDGVTEAVATKTIEESDKAHRAWAMALYGIDPTDPDLYDVVVHVGRVSAQYAADMICTMAQLPTFRSTRLSRVAVEDLALAASMEAALMKLADDVEVTSRHGEVTIAVKPRRIRAGTSREFYAHYQEDVEQRIRELTVGIKGLKRIEVKVVRPA